MTIKVDADSYAKLAALDAYLRQGQYADPYYLNSLDLSLARARLLVTAGIAAECKLTGTLSLVRKTRPPLFTDAFALQ